jgi:beta-galactosidase
MLKTVMSLRTWGICLVFLLTAFVHAASVSGENPRRVTSMDSGWLFTRGDPTNAEANGFDDNSWRWLNVPHDWSIEGPFDEKNPTGGAGGFLPAGVGWYRKHFALPEDCAGRNVFIEFDGVMANSNVWVNGFHLGHQPYGYVSFRYELTRHLNFGAGKTNVLAVRVDNSAQPASRWYSGAGIYRHVRLIVTDPLHFDHWATFVSTPAVSSNQATVHLETTVTNQSGRSQEVAVVFQINGPGLTKPVTTETSLQKIDAGSSASFHAHILLKTPRLWNLTAPNLYSGSAILESDGKTFDQETVSFGIREARFEPDTGFWLNGANIKIKGVCLHHDCGALGAAVPVSAWERRLTTLKELGCNAIRTAHNPPAPEFLDLCDQMGFLVMDEMFDCWTVAKNRYDYHVYFEEWARIDTRDTVRRDRNHPSVIIYSAGNEIHDTPKAELAKRILRGLVEVFHENDPTRPVSQALFRPNVSHDYDNGLADLLDVIGQNYRENEILAAHQAKPTRKILGTENGHDRRVWLALRDNPSYAGQFLWSGIDYLGESRRWPVIGAGSGLLDRTGTPRPRAWQRQSWWSDIPMVRMARHVVPVRSTNAEPGGLEVLSRPQTEFCDWTPRNLEPHDEEVEVYSNCEEVELLLNGKSLGRKALPPDAAPRTWTVPFAPGAISVIGRNKGEQVATDELRTAGKPAKVRLISKPSNLTPDWDDVAYVEAAVVDEKGVLVPDAGDLISFKMSGPAAVVAVDNGDNASHEPFQASERHAYQGRCFAIVRASAEGTMALTATASNLTPATIALQAKSK